MTVNEHTAWYRHEASPWLLERARQVGDLLAGRVVDRRRPGDAGIDDPVHPRRAWGSGSRPIHVLVAFRRLRSRRPNAANWAIGHGASAAAGGSYASLPPARPSGPRTWAAEDLVSSRAGLPFKNQVIRLKELFATDSVYFRKARRRDEKVAALCFLRCVPGCHDFERTRTAQK